MASQVDLVIILAVVVLPLLFWFRESLPFIGGGSKRDAFGREINSSGGGAGADDDEDGDPRDFVTKMTKAVSGLRTSWERAAANKT